MKLSLYNLSATEQGKMILYNSLYKNIVELGSEDSTIFFDLEKKSLEAATEEGHALLSFLADQLFIVDDEMDELAYFKLQYNRSLFASGTTRHTILPNLSCNCDCPYCFENKNGNFMTRETEQNYLSWLESQTDTLNHLHIAWYGGEPLLSKGIISRITQGVLSLSERYGFEYSASLITNGVLLDEEFAQQADDLHIYSIQVTLDGDKPYHDKSRFLKNANEGTFDYIVHNMSKYCELTRSKVASILRVNVTDENYHTMEQMLEKLPRSIREQCVLMFHWVFSHADGRNPNMNFSEQMQGNAPFANLASLYSKAEAMGFTTNSFDEGVAYNFCECDFDNSFYIDQDGDLFTCTHSMNKTDSVGNVCNGFGSQSNLSKYAKFVNVGPLADQECLGCRLLPLCKGGCRRARFLGKKVCSDVKYSTEEYVLQKYHKMLKERG